MITKEMIEKKAREYASIPLPWEDEDSSSLCDFIAGANCVLNEIEKQRCDNCKNGQPSSLSEGIIFCGVLDYRFNPDFYCKYWEAKNNEKE